MPTPPVVPTEITVREGEALHKAVAAALAEDEVQCELTQAQLEELMIDYPVVEATERS